MVTPGGEAAFVSRMVDESIVLGGKLGVCSSLLGKFSSVTLVVAHLRANKVENFTIKTLERGRTKRWVVVWSVGDRRIPQGSRGKVSGGLASLLPPSDEHVYHCAEGLDAEEARAVVAEVWETAGVRTQQVEGIDLGSFAPPHSTEAETDSASSVAHAWLVSADSNTWSRAARRARARVSQASSAQPSPTTQAAQANPIIECQAWIELKTLLSSHLPDDLDPDRPSTKKTKLTHDQNAPNLVHASTQNSPLRHQVCVHMRWTRGFDKHRSDFDGLWALVARRLGDKGKELRAGDGGAGAGSRVRKRQAGVLGG